MGHGTLTGVLRAHLTTPDAVDRDPPADLELTLAQVVSTAERAWPDIRLPAEAFVGRIAPHYSNDGSLIDWLRHVRADDLFLACACAERVPNAIDTFDRELLSAVPAMLVRGGFRDLQPDEVRQRIRERLFVRSKIEDYSGRGSLASWLQVITLRIAIDVTREQKVMPVVESPPEDDLRVAGTDPELSLIKERYREPFKQALRTSIAELTDEQRNLLKLHFVDSVTLDKLAALFHVHRATIVRRIAQARDAVFDGVRALLQAELGVDDAEFDELLTLLRSRLELSLSALMPGVVK